MAAAEDADLVLLNTCSIREKAEQTVRNRLGQINYFKKKKPGLVVGVLGCMAERLKARFLDEEQLVDLVVGPDAYRSLPTLLANEGYDPTYGARPLKRVIQSRLQNSLANAILGGEFPEGSTILAGGAPVVGETYFVAGVFDYVNGDMFLYVDGQEVASNTNIAAWTVTSWLEISCKRAFSTSMRASSTPSTP